MSMTGLCLHRGATPIEAADLDYVTTPEPTPTWTPVPHSNLVASVKDAVISSGNTIVSEQHSIYKGGDRYFGILHLGSHNNEGNTIIGIRNSHDKTFPAGLSLGNRVFVCDNLSFSGDVTVARKHTRYINNDLDRLIFDAVGKLADLRVKQEARFDAYKGRTLTDPETHDLIIRALLAKVVSGEQVTKVVGEWRQPSHEEFEPRTLWSLFNDFTETLKGTAPMAAVKRTMVLHGLFDAHCQLGV